MMTDEECHLAIAEILVAPETEIQMKEEDMAVTGVEKGNLWGVVGETAVIGGKTQHFHFSNI